jgi:hypothetical protein
MARQPGSADWPAVPPGGAVAGGRLAGDGGGGAGAVSTGSAGEPGRSGGVQITAQMNITSSSVMKTRNPKSTSLTSAAWTIGRLPVRPGPA